MKNDITLKTSSDKPSIWAQIATWVVRYPIALIGAVGVVLLTILAVALGKQDAINPGGMLGSLFGKKKPESRVTIANEVPEDRTTSQGSSLPKSTTDDLGYVQREVVVLPKRSNPFRDKSKILIEDQEGKKKSIVLPKGVYDTDVDKVLEVKAQVYKVTVKSRPEGRISSKDLTYLD